MGETKSSELSIPREMKHLTFRVWCRKPGKTAINIISPSGQNSQFIMPKIRVYRTIKYVKENTTLDVSIFTPEAITGNQMIVLEFSDIKPGIWTIQLKSQHDDSFKYDIWLPPKETLPDGTQFLNPDPYVTFTIPSATRSALATSYYDQNLNTMNAIKAKCYLLYGTSKRSIDSYPNKEWGWGKLDLEGTFNFISGNRGYAIFSDYIEYFNKNLFIRIPKELGDDIYES